MHESFNKGVWRLFYALSPKIYAVALRRRVVGKYIIAGGTAALVDIGMLYLLKGFWGLPLIPSVALAFLTAFGVSFVLQKFWAFEDMSTKRVHAQMILYFAVSGVNFFLNLALMYFLVEIAGLWYLPAKVFVSGGIAFSSFFVYRFFIFKP